MVRKNHSILAILLAVFVAGICLPSANAISYRAQYSKESSDCRNVDWSSRKERLKQMDFTMSELVKSAWWIKWIVQTVEPFRARFRTMTSRFFLGYFVDAFDVDIGIHGLSTVSMYNFRPKAGNLAFNLDAQQLHGNIFFEADYQRQSLYANNVTFCPQFGFDWLQKCPRNRRFINATFTIQDFNSDVVVNAEMKECSGGPIERSLCFIRSSLAMLFSVLPWKMFQKFLERFSSVTVSEIKLSYKVIKIDGVWFRTKNEALQGKKWEYHFSSDVDNLDLFSYSVNVELLQEIIKVNLNQYFASLQTRKIFKGQCYNKAFYTDIYNNDDDRFGNPMNLMDD